MKWVNPPVALMFHAGAPRLRRAGLSLPAHAVAGDPGRVAFEAYPGMVARSLVGRQSYKSDERARQTPERHAWRERLLVCLQEGRPEVGAGSASSSAGGPDERRPVFSLSHRLRLAPAIALECLEDASGDALDAVMCLALAAWAWERREQGWGLPADLDPLEGWIVGA